VKLVDVSRFLPPDYRQPAGPEGEPAELEEEEPDAVEVVDINQLLQKQRHTVRQVFTGGDDFEEELATVNAAVARAGPAPSPAPGRGVEEGRIEDSAEDIFASILAGEAPSLGSGPASTPATTTTTASTTTSPAPPPSSPPELVTPLGRCKEFCSMAGTLAVAAGLRWSEPLRHPSSPLYRELAASLTRALTALLRDAYFGRALEYVEVEAFEQRKDGPGVLVDIFIKLTGLAFDLTTESIKEVVEEGLEGKLLPGTGLQLDLTRSYFLVTETELKNKVPCLSDVTRALLSRWSPTSSTGWRCPTGPGWSSWGASSPSASCCWSAAASGCSGSPRRAWWRGAAPGPLAPAQVLPPHRNRDVHGRPFRDV
jgi:hypothetical protein